MSGVVVWFTGLPRAGKSTIAARVAEALRAHRRPTVILDGDEIRSALVPRPGYDDAARDAFYATLGQLAVLLAHQGLVVLVPATAHRSIYRDEARARSPRFLEIFLATPREVCEERDQAGLYRSAAHEALPGVGVNYETPSRPEIVVEDARDPAACDQIVALIGD